LLPLIDGEKTRRSRTLEKSKSLEIDDEQVFERLSYVVI
jgi:hypothetical protein